MAVGCLYIIRSFWRKIPSVDSSDYDFRGVTVAYNVENENQVRELFGKNSTYGRKD